MSFRSEIEAHVASGYSLLYISTYEELRARIVLRDVAQKLGKTFYLWSTTVGLCKVQGDELEKIENTQQPEEILRYLFEDFGTEEEAVMSVIVLCDFHRYLEDAMPIRVVRELGSRFKEKGHNLILLSPVFVIPPELRKDITLVEFDLPDKEELNKVVEDIGEENEIVIEEKKRNKILESLCGLTTSEAENALALSIYNQNTFEPVELMKIKSATIKKSGILEYYESEYTMADVGGFPVLKNWLDLRANAFLKEAVEYGLDTPKGILLLGVPGCGKSLVAKAVCNLWRFPLLRLDLGRVFGSLVGQSEENIRSALKLAEAVSPSILFIDEIEKGLAGGASSGRHDSGVTSRVFGTILTWMQDKKKPVFVIATANNISALPPEFLRKGRFDEIFFVDLPNARERKEIFEIHLNRKKRKPKNFDIMSLVEKTDAFTGSEIEEVVKSALFLSFSDGKRKLKTRDMLEAIERTIPLSKTMSVELEAIRKWSRDRAVNVSEVASTKRLLKKKRIRKIARGIDPSAN